MSKQKLELTWVGKDVRPRLEPRVLLEDVSKSYTAAHRVSENDLFENKLIHGDNLLALKALEQEYQGKVKCIYIDPPFNTNQDLEYYLDGLEHSAWLGLMRDRLEILYKLLEKDGCLFVHIDDNEVGYLIAVLDEIFGRRNRISMITFKQGAATGHKSINPGVVSTSNFILLYAKDKSVWSPNRVYVGRNSRDARYSQFIENFDSGFSSWSITTLNNAFGKAIGIEPKKLKKVLGDEFESKITDFVLQNADRVIRMARPDYSAISKAAQELIDRSKENPNEVFILNRDNLSDMLFLNGERILFYSDKLKLIDGELISGEPLTSIWDDLLSNNLHNEGGVDFPKSKKPESLIKRCLELTTLPGDLVLDSFAGSGTTGAVAHKMGRRWIMVEIKDHAHTHVIPRLKRVIDGEDTSGITSSVGWQGGGGFRYYHLAPTLIVKDRFGQEIINPAFNAEMLAEAVCKLEGFTYSPSSSQEEYWMHGRSTERDFIYVTTQHLSATQLQVISDDVGDERTLLVMCSAFDADPDGYPNLTVKKIPQSILHKCEWGKDDYSLRVSNLPMLDPSTEESLEAASEARGKGAQRRKKREAGMTPLFDADGEA